MFKKSQGLCWSLPRTPHYLSLLEFDSLQCFVGHIVVIVGIKHTAVWTEQKKSVKILGEIFMLDNNSTLEGLPFDISEKIYAF